MEHKTSQHRRYQPAEGPNVALASGDLERETSELRESESRYHSLIRGAAHGFCRISGDGTILEVNPSLVEMLEYESETQLAGQNLFSDVYLYPVEGISTVSGMRSEDGLHGTELQWKQRSGKHLTVRLSGRRVPVSSRAAEEFEILSEDVTERRELERQLRQAQKMEAMGRLAGCIAHDFNNLLGIILGYCEVLSEKIDEKQPVWHPVIEIRKAGQRAASLTGQLLAFSRQQVMAAKPLDVNGVISDSIHLLQRLVGEDVVLNTILDPDLGLVKADHGQLTQAIIHLAIHAIDSMPEGGGLTLATARCQIDEDYAREHTPMAAGSYTALEISDTGSGLSAESRVRVFEPFYNTKKLGTGSGLGLAAVYGIVKQNGGYIWVESEVGKGSTFRILLPTISTGPLPAADNKTIRTETDSQKTVMVVEDTGALRDLITSFLKASGYALISANDGEDALLLAASHSGPIHLLLTDVLMPGISGPQLARNLSAARPSIRVLYMSGYTDNTNLRNELTESEAAFVQKPFSRQALITKVREVLDAQN